MKERLVKIMLLAFLVMLGAGSVLTYERVVADSSPVSGLPQLTGLISSHLKERSEQFTIDYSDNKDELSRKLPSIIKAALAADDYTAYIVDSYHYTIRTWSNKAKIRMTVVFRESKSQTAIVDWKVKEIIRSIVKPEMNDHQKVKAIHDWIVFNVKYDRQLQRYTAYEALVNRRAVCQGYSLLANKMLQEAGIKNKIVEGKVSTGDHAWNLVFINGAWYHLDVTWDDPLPDKGKQASYDYYLKTDKQMREDHSWTRIYPEASKSYSETLKALAGKDPARGLFYRELEIELGFHWVKPEHTIADADGLKKRIETAAAAGDKSFKARYLHGKQVEQDMKKAMLAVGSVSSYRLQYTSFGNDGAVLLEVQFEPWS